EFATDKPVATVRRYLHRGFLWHREDDKPLAFIPHHELFHRFHTRRRIRRLRGGRAMDAFLEIEPGDYVVHADHGVARFLGLRTMKTVKSREGAGEEFLTLEFAGKAKLHVPASQIDKVQKYIGGGRGAPPLSTLGGKKWQRQKEQVSEAVRDLAAEMLRIQAARQHMPGVRYPADTAWQREFEAEFPYDETEDQLAALSEIKRDMTSARPMDRLICGDVGYGKTEVAIRAAFKAAEYGKQVAVLVPTTVLAEQHEQTFRQRFAAYPFRIASLSRFKTAKEQNEVLELLKKGQVDIIIGTHRLLSQDIRFNDLGLVIIDEEQRFGVEHKQRLLSLRMTVDVLTLSATPIPRTLHMALLGLRDISSLSTPPMDRRAVVTEVIPYNERRIQQAIERELARDGQVFFVHNRVHNINSVADDVRRLAPDARIVIGHGQMAPKELEKVMLRFMRRDADILVSTTIIESGIDIPTANTMFINDADRFGLADLHQLRGRVGRHKHRAYCYLLQPLDRTLSPSAKRRLRAIEEFSMLGAGFKIAMRDLEIRGAGNLLGAEQSGHIATVGYEMYCRLLERAVSELKNEDATEPTETVIEIGVIGAFPKAYIPSDSRRMEAYRRISAARSFEELHAIEEDITQAYGEPPLSAQRLLRLAEIRVGARQLEVSSIILREKDIVFETENVAPICEALRGAQGTVRPLPPKSPGAPREVYYRPPENFLESDTLLAVLRRRLSPQPAETAA
ncbi:MAG: transcription-repair coupling factor, partial [Planctomycetota bacterium]|nr:transcription-repair coupling factor [Planctomycetota bacterium]